MTRIVRLFAAICSALSCSGLFAQQPLVVSLSPPHLEIEVDPTKVKELVVTFDRDMDPARHALCGGGPSFPRVRGTRWTDARTFVVEVELERDRVYSMDLACAGSAGFRAADGGALLPEPWRFSTLGVPLADGAAALAAERLFGAIRDHYSYRDRLGIDWRVLERMHFDELRAAPSGAALALRCAELLGAAQDPHILVTWLEATVPTFQRAVVANFDLGAITRAFPKARRIGRIGLAAQTDDGIGYLLINSFAREQRDDFERALQALRGLLDCKAIVIDVRLNGGGDETLARRLAGFFVRGERVYAKQRVRDPKVETEFREVDERKVQGHPVPDIYRGPVAVLMGPLDMSSTEAFLLMMKQVPQAVLVGERSYGSSGNPQQHAVMPGLVVHLPSWQALRPDGTCFEGEGIAPHIHVRTEAGDFGDKDPVLEEALLRLRGQR